MDDNNIFMLELNIPIVNKPMDTNTCIQDFLCTIEGWKTKVKNLHWAAPRMNVHKLLDEIAEFINDYQDSLAEDCMGINGKFNATFLKGNPCDCTETAELMKEMSVKAQAFYNRIPNDSTYCGIKSETETFIHNIKKYTYLTGLAV